MYLLIWFNKKKRKCIKLYIKKLIYFAYLQIEEVK